MCYYFKNSSWTLQNKAQFLVRPSEDISKLHCTYFIYIRVTWWILNQSKSYLYTYSYIGNLNRSYIWFKNCDTTILQFLQVRQCHSLEALDEQQTSYRQRTKWNFAKGHGSHAIWFCGLCSYKSWSHGPFWHYWRETGNQPFVASCWSPTGHTWQVYIKLKDIHHFHFTRCWCIY